MNYKVLYWNNVEYDIYKTPDEVDGVSVFNTFTEAKNKLLSNLRGEKKHIEREIKSVLKLKEQDTL